MELQVVTDIAPDDPMYRAMPELYFEAGPLALRYIELARSAAGQEDAGRILDFGCGFGRVQRTLRAAFPEAEITACDLREDGIAFCAQTFGAVPVLSDPEPEDISLERNAFDVLWSGSHLTHIEEDRWTDFLKLWEVVLAPGGIAVFTVTGHSAASGLRSREHPLDQSAESGERMLREYAERGFAFGRGRAMGGGDTLTSPAWVCKQLEQTPQLRLLLYTEGAWLGQDVVACLKEPSSPAG